MKAEGCKIAAIAHVNLFCSAIRQVDFGQLACRNKRNGVYLIAWENHYGLSGSMVMNSEGLLAKLREIKPIVEARYKAKEIGLFGSFVRGDQSAGSDIDVLVDFKEGADLFDLMGLSIYLEEALQRKVDVVPKHALREELRESVLLEVVSI
jgi:predicted nucleotidyltransferase